MSNAIIHAESSVKRWGGSVEDYLPVHKWLDQTKGHVGDNRHRLILHNSFGIQLAVDSFGDSLTNSEGRRVFVRDIAERHVLEDLGAIPSLAECLRDVKVQPWMAGSRVPRGPANTGACTAAPDRPVYSVAVDQRWMTQVFDGRGAETHAPLDQSILDNIQKRVEEIKKAREPKSADLLEKEPNQP